jgi:catechol 2,3-dioxygenase-like lactoylglutathione lyase family enzyme
MPIDHVLFATRDFGDAAAWFRERGLGAIEGGRHTGWGTANWIVPLGATYVEIVGVVEPEVAFGDPFVRRALEAIAAGGGLYAWCVVPRDFDATVTRLGLVAAPGSRRRHDGVMVAWRTAGLEVALRDPSRPFFLAWEMAPELHPGRGHADHRVQPLDIAWVEVAGDEGTVRRWLGDEPATVLIRPGPPALRAIGIATTDGEIVIRAEIGASRKSAAD